MMHGWLLGAALSIVLAAAANAAPAHADNAPAPPLANGNGVK